MSGRLVRCALALLFAAPLLQPDAAFANWRIRKVVNAATQPLTYALPIGKPGVDDAGSLGQVRGDAVLLIPGRGALRFQDIGHGSPCSRPYWGVSIVLGSQKWGYFYDGNGVLDVSISADGSPTFTAVSESSQVVNGDGPPTCTAR